MSHHVESWQSDVDQSYGWSCFTCGWAGLNCGSWQSADREAERHRAESSES